MLSLVFRYKAELFPAHLGSTKLEGNKNIVSFLNPDATIKRTDDIKDIHTNKLLLPL